MANILVTYLIDLWRVRDHFISFSTLHNQYESYKIWARWLITHQSLRSQPCLHLPTISTDDDLQIVVEMLNKGSTLDRAKLHSYALTHNARDMVKKYGNFLNSFGKSNQGFRQVYELPIVHKYKSPNCVILELPNSQWRYTVPLALYTKMCKNFIGLKNYARHMIWYTYTQYQLLDGKSLQWALPNGLLQYLSDDFDCNTELFASPMNHYYRDYYSLYKTDQLFGSKGNFFEAPATQFQQGCFQVNPPFIDIIFTKTSKCILSLLESADVANRDLTFIYILPDWKELQGMDMLLSSKFCQNVITIRANEHYYYQSHRESYIKVHFTTQVLILSTRENVCPHYKRRNIIRLFKYPMWS